MAFTSVTLFAGTGYRTATGATPPVRIRAKPLVEMTNGTVVVKDEVVIPLGSNGVATKPIYATTDPATTPAGNAYRFYVETPFGVERSFLAAVPHDAGSSLDIANLVELESPPDLVGIADAAVITPVAQPYAASITPNAGAGSFRYTVATGDFTLQAPSGGVDGQPWRYLVTASGGARVVTFDAAIFRAGSLASTLTIPSGKRGQILLSYESGYGWTLLMATSA